VRRLLSICAVPLLGAALLQAQDQPPVRSTDTRTGETTESVPRRAENRDWGWLGLLGLFGLAGLRRRRPAEILRTEERSGGFDEGRVRKVG
jgi:MYXO-CTERM domain-containing protein